MRSIPHRGFQSINPSIPKPGVVWRDALGPGYAVGVAESLIQIAGSAAQRPYRAQR